MGRVTFHYEGAEIRVQGTGITSQGDAEDCLRDFLDSMESDGDE